MLTTPCPSWSTLVNNWDREEPKVLDVVMEERSEFRKKTSEKRIRNNVL